MCGLRLYPSEAEQVSKSQDDGKCGVVGRTVWLFCDVRRVWFKGKIKPAGETDGRKITRF